MNEYIILNLCNGSIEENNSKVDLQDKTVVPISRIRHFFVEPSGLTRMILYSFHTQGEFEKFEVKESPAEIEALIMGRNESNWRECMRGMDKEISDGYTDYKDLENRYKILQEENAKLKEELKGLAHKLPQEAPHVGIFAHLSWHQLNARLHYSNPANPCCRETFKRLSEIHAVEMSQQWVVYPHGEKLPLGQPSFQNQVLDERWVKSFKDKIEENKNDSV